jgi:hypothetical protein
MNQIHGRFSIANDDFLYVLSTFIFEPIRWNARFGWRPMCEQERHGYFHFWCAVGRLMNIKEIPCGYDEFERFNLNYEHTHFRFSDANQRIGAATRDLFLSWFPRPLHSLVRPAIYAMMDDALIEAFGFPRPSHLMRRLVGSALWLRALALRWFPARRRPCLRTEMRQRSYPDGCPVEDIGPSPAGNPGTANP